jgi:hypothetical protein
LSEIYFEYSYELCLRINLEVNIIFILFPYLKSDNEHFQQVRLFYRYGMYDLDAASSLCCQLLKKVCLESTTCGSLMCTDDLLEILLKPLKYMLTSKKTSNDAIKSHIYLPNEQGLIRLAEVLAAMASNDTGYQYLIRTSTTTTNTYVLYFTRFIYRHVLLFHLECHQRCRSSIMLNISSLSISRVKCIRLQLIYQRAHRIRRYQSIYWRNSSMFVD